ncbi:hypothetical protein N9N88_00890 [Candidatus Poseidoniaceae archaeon]|nr:hypothetical protein [Candidatus Poseidoniaceae archaeon]
MVALFIRCYLVLFPLRRIYKRYTLKFQDKKVGRIKLRTIFRNLRVFQKETSIRGIETFLFRESILAMAPIIAAAAIRLSLGTPSIEEWSQGRLITLYSIFFVWLLFNIKRSLDMNSSLQPLERWYSHPVLINSGLNSAIWSRRKLVQLSNIEIPDNFEKQDATFQPILHRSEDDGKRRVNPSAILENAIEVGSVIKKAAHGFSNKAKQSTKHLSSTAIEHLDNKVQNQVDSIIGSSSSQIIVASFVHIIMVLGPLFAIYGLN